MTKLWILVVFFATSKSARGGFYVPNLPDTRYIREGDINLGAIFPVSSYSATKPCGDGLRSTVILQFVESLVYAIDDINNSSDILPNITLGFVVLDDCLKGTTTIAQTLSFIPEINSCTEVCANDTQSRVTPRFDVVGVVGSLRSSNSIAAASLLGPIQIPQISYSSTSDELSNKVLYPYFMRVVPPDEFQAEAIVSLIVYYKWSYISIIYSEGSYGELGFKNIKRLTDAKGICISTANKIAFGAVAKDYNKAARDLLDNSNAKVVVIFTGPIQARGLFTALKSIGSKTKFIFIGSDGWAKRIKNLGDVWDVGLGAFTVSFYSEEDPSFTEYFKQIRPTANVEDPWFREFWERHFSCSFNSSTTPCDPNSILSSSNGFVAVPTVTPVMDAVYTFARGIHTMIREKCPGANATTARECITGPMLLQYLKNTTFTGINGLIKFDEKGNQLGRYMIDQLVQGVPYKQVQIATYSALSREITMNQNNKVTWRYVDWFWSKHPTSICSLPCGLGEFRIQKELTCCWECKMCRSNEIVVANGTNCLSCPLFTWPEVLTNLTTCTPIIPTSITVDEPLAMMLMTLACLGVVASLAVVIYYIKNNEAKCIKASSRELSFLMLVGVFIGYLTVFGLVAKPEQWSCKTNFFFFCLSFTWIYGPLLTRTTRIYRIFESGKKSNKRPRFIDPISQMAIAALLIIGQVCISTAIIVLSSPKAILTMPVLSQRYVELSCDLTLYGLSSFLIYNIILIFVCSIFAFRSRKLPDNFNETRFISMCVYTTLVIWLAFIPTYFTAGREYLKTVSLAIALILNCTVILLFLYAPKIYATMYLEGGDISFSKTKSTGLTGISSYNGTSMTNTTQRPPNLTKVQPIVSS